MCMFVHVHFFLNLLNNEITFPKNTSYKLSSHPSNVIFGKSRNNEATCGWILQGDFSNGPVTNH